METEIDETLAEERLKDLPTTTQNPAFASGEMIACAACARTNPPTRAQCFYCGAALEISDAQAEFLKQNLRTLEAWQKGYNVIFSPDTENFGGAQIERAARLLQLEASVLRHIIEAKTFLPLARVETKIEAEAVQKNLRETSNVETKIVSDADLNEASPPRRLRAMNFADEEISVTLFNADETVEFAWTDLVLIVTGAIFERRISGVEARGRRGGENKIVDSNETAADEILIDIYSRDDSIGFRVEQHGFDFSCLGTEKGLLAAENLRLLVKRLGERAPSAKIVENYLLTRAQLSAIWAVEERTDSLGLKRDRFAKFNRENLTTINNQKQFTKFSRLQRRLV